ncbi:MAG: shikimate kinase [Candidatus Neomarinimicrobiota bacterium]
MSRISSLPSGLASLPHVAGGWQALRFDWQWQEEMTSSKKNIFLVGMMGSGKTSIGRALAERLSMTFIDTDIIIRERTQKSITKIFREWGEERFRELERSLLEEKARENNQVFSTGGGIVLDKNSRRILRDRGITVLLEASPRALALRIGNPTSRPLLKQAKDAKNHLAQIWKEREEAYRSVASLTVSTDEMTHDGAVELIIRHIRKSRENH